MTDDMPRTTTFPATAIIVLVLLVACIGIWLVMASQASDEQPMDSMEQDVVSSLGLIMLLPSDEKPIITTIHDLESVKDEPFHKYAKIGDIVLRYPRAGRAILYSPSENMIVEAVPR